MNDLERITRSLNWLKERLDKVNAELDSNAVWLSLNYLEKLKWKRFNDSFPEGRRHILLWVDCGNGGFPVVGKVEDDRAIWWWSYKGRAFLDDPSRALWMDITEPE